MACAICEIRRPRRFCPGVRGEICSLCCGNERENTVDCPLDCEYLREAHKHEKPLPVDPETLPNKELRVSEEYLREHEEFVVFLGRALVKAALRIPQVIDYDVREALDAAIRTLRTQRSGLVYESRPANPLAAALSSALLEAIEEYRKIEFERLGIHKTRDSVPLGLLVFMQHFELSFNNGRRKGKAFLDTLFDFYPLEPEVVPPAASSLILP